MYITNMTKRKKNLWIILLFYVAKKRAQMVEYFLQKTLGNSYKWSLVSSFFFFPLQPKRVKFTRKRKLDILNCI